MYWRCVIILGSLSAAAEVVDRIAATVGGTVVTLSEALVQARVAAFLNEQPAIFTGAVVRQSVERLVEQALIRREIESGDYAPADPGTGKALVAELRQTRFAGREDAFQAALRAYGLTDTALEEQLQWQSTVLRFVDQRFRAGVQIPLEDIADDYRVRFVPEWRSQRNTPAPPLEEVEAEIEDRLRQQQVASLLDRWLNQSRTQTEIRFHDRAWVNRPEPDPPQPSGKGEQRP